MELFNTDNDEFWTFLLVVIIAMFVLVIFYLNFGYTPPIENANLTNGIPPT